jgi:hypothetical protein
MKINYHHEMEKIIKKLAPQEKPTLLLHSCCAPCSSYVLESLSKSFEITVLFYNPNLIDQAEFDKRYEEQVRINEVVDASIALIKLPYIPEEYYDKVSGLEKDKEGGKRCELCFQLRLEESAKYACDHHFDFFTTSLSISPMKNAQLLNELGIKIGQDYGITYLISDFKKKNGYKRSVELSKENDLYRQDYCGCIYSKEERANQI